MKPVVEKIKVHLIAILSVLLGLLLSLFVLYTPTPKTADTEGSFSAVRAAAHIEQISRKPHSYYDQVELEEVRVYLEETLKDYLGNANVTRYTYDVNEVEIMIGETLPYDLVNLVGKIEGRNEEGILILAHYDSRGHVGRAGELGRSFGAMDDGYGVGSLLELAYIFKDLELENSIYFLFTDAEEVGLYGAKVAAIDPRIVGQVKFVINLESRGRYGPAYMFETSKGNEKVINLYTKAKLPVTYSMATAVYSVMPNSTDFTPFIEADFPGLNFATLAGIDNYHSPLDAYENINLSSIQHMGTQVEPVIREFVSQSRYVENDYFKATNDQVFFTLLPGVLIHYSQAVAVILVIVLVLGLAGYLFVTIKQKTFTKETFTKTLPKGLALTLGLVVTGYLFSRIVAFLGKAPFSLTYTRVSGFDFITLLFMVVMLLGFKLFARKAEQNRVLLIGVIINLLLTILTTFTLPGASFLFAVASLFGLVGLFTDYLANKWVKHPLYAISYIIQLLIIIPLLYSFYMALTVGGTAILVLLLVINLSVTVPLINKHIRLEKVMTE